MAAHPGYSSTSNFSIYGPGFTSGAGAYAPNDAQWGTARVEFKIGDTLALFRHISGASVNNQPISATPTAHKGYIAEGIGGLWWERVHILPRSIVLGNILSTVDTTIDIFNAFRATAQNWNTFVNGAGAGTDMIGETLTEVFDPLEGRLFTFRVLTDGPSQVSAILQYVFGGGGGTILQPISFVRLVVFPYLPEQPVFEELSWLTDVFQAESGAEQRVALRDYPRQSFEFRLQRSTPKERQELANRLFDRQEIPWGLPDWTKPAELRLAATAGDTVLTLVRTSYSDFRIGENLLLWVSEVSFESALVTGVTPTTLTVNAPLQFSWPVGTVVMSMRTAALGEVVPLAKHLTDLEIFDLRFRVVDNVTQIGQANSWSVFNNKVLLDDPNFVSGTVAEEHSIPVTLIDNETSRFTQFTTSQGRGRRASVKTFVTKDRKDLFRVLQLLHFLRGRQTSFYLPTFRKEFTLLQALVSGASTALVENNGYSTFSASRTPRNVLRVVKTDGTSIIRTITSASEIDSSQEQLNVSPVWPSNVPLADVSYVDIVEKVRLDSDQIKIEHRIPGKARISLPVRTVFE